MAGRKREPKEAKTGEGLAVVHVVRHVALLIEKGGLKPGSQLPPERQLADDIGVSRPTIRAGLQALVGMGVVEARHGAGTFITGGPPALGTEPLGLLAALHGFTPDGLFEARRVLEISSAGLASERATGDQFAPMSDEVTGMYASLDDPQAFLVHDVRFHRAVASGSDNLVIARAGRDGDLAALRAPAGDDGAGQRPARLGRDAPPHLPGDPRP